MENQHNDFDEFDNLDEALGRFEGQTVEGGYDPETDEDEGCAGGACKI